MKKKQIPQDESALQGANIRELCYAVNEEGKYETGLSTGWDIKSDALKEAWVEIERRTEDALEKVKNGEASPILYFMEKRLMDVAILAAYTGFWKWTVKRHLKPKIFKRLSDKKLARYAEVFEISLDGLKSFPS